MSRRKAFWIIAILAAFAAGLIFIQAYKSGGFKWFRSQEQNMTGSWRVVFRNQVFNSTFQALMDLRQIGDELRGSLSTGLAVYEIRGRLYKGQLLIDLEHKTYIGRRMTLEGKVFKEGLGGTYTSSTELPDFPLRFPSGGEWSAWRLTEETAAQFRSPLSGTCKGTLIQKPFIFFATAQNQIVLDLKQDNSRLTGIIGQGQLPVTGEIKNLTVLLDFSWDGKRYRLRGDPFFDEFGKLVIKGDLLGYMEPDEVSSASWLDIGDWEVTKSR